MSLQLVLAGDPECSAGFSSGTAAPQKPSSQPLEEWQKCNSRLARTSPIPQVPGIKTLKMFAPGAIIKSLLAQGLAPEGPSLVGACSYSCSINVIYTVQLSRGLM